MADDAGTGASNDGSDVWLTLAIGLAVFVVLMILFEVLVCLIPNLYFYRRYLEDHPWIKDWNFKPVVSPPLPGKWPLSWMVKSNQLPIESMMETHGMDVCTMVASLEELFYIFLYLSLFGMVILAPTFATGPNKNLETTNDLFTTGLSVITMSNLETRDKRLWVAWIYELLSPILVMFVLYRGYQRYAKWRRQYKALDIPNNYAVIISDIPPKFQTDKAIATFFDEILPGCVAKAHVAWMAPDLQALQAKYMAAVTNREYYQRLAVDAGARVTRKGCCGRGKDKDGDGEPDDMIEVYQESEDKLLAEILEEQEKRDPQHVLPTHSGFVMFHDKNHAAIFGQVASWVRNTEWVVRPAPEIMAIDWRKTDDSQWSRKTEDFSLAVFILVILIVWVPIVVFIQGLSNIENLVTTDAFKWLDFILDWPDWLINLLQGFLPPILLSIANVLIPIFVKLHMSFKFAVDIGVLEAKSRDVYMALLAFINFFYNLGLGAAISSISLIVSGEANIIDLIAKQIPIQSFFMMKFIINNTFISMPGLLLQYPRFIWRPLIAGITGTTTIRQQEKLNFFLSKFNHFKFHGLAVSMALIGLAYASVAPIMCVFCTLYYFMASSVFKFGHYYNWYLNYTFGGILYPGYFYYVCVCMYVKQIFMAALFAVYLAPEITACMIVPILFTLQLQVTITRRFRDAAERGALYETHLDDVPDELPAEFLADSYVHPGLIPPKPLMDLSGATKAEIENIDNLEPDVPASPRSEKPPISPRSEKPSSSFVTKEE